MNDDSPRPGERPGHPTVRAAILLVLVTLLIVGLAAASTW